MKKKREKIFNKVNQYMIKFLNHLHFWVFMFSRMQCTNILLPRKILRRLFVQNICPAMDQPVGIVNV